MSSDEMARSLDNLVTNETRSVEFFSPSFSDNEKFCSMVKEAVAKSDKEKTKSSPVKFKVKCYSSLCLDYEQWPARHDINPNKVAKESFTLSELQRLGCEVIWRPYLEKDQHILVVDQKIAYVYDKEHVSLRKIPFDKRASRLSSKSGYFIENKGKVVLIQELIAKPYDVDLVVRLKEDQGDEKSGANDSVGAMPVFLHSQCLENKLDCGDIIEVSGVVNISGEGVMGSSVPSDLFVEGLGVRWVKKAYQLETSKYPPRLKFRDEVLKLLHSDPKFSSNVNLAKSKKKQDDWIVWAFKNVQTILRERGLFMQSGDDSFIMTTLHNMIALSSAQPSDSKSFS